MPKSVENNKKKNLAEGEKLTTMTALIIDDELDICHLVCSMLTKEGLTCQTFNSFSDGKNDIEINSYDITLLDLNLPDGSGFDLIPVIKDKNRGGRLIVISAHDSDEERSRALKLGADGFISKPFSKKDILNTIKSV